MAQFPFLLCRLSFPQALVLPDHRLFDLQVIRIPVCITPIYTLTEVKNAVRPAADEDAPLSIQPLVLQVL